MYNFSKGFVYFLTGSTFLHYPYFKDPQDKEIVLDQIGKLQREKNIQICAYSIQINHYHLLFYAREDTDLKTVKQYMHGGISFWLRRSSGGFKDKTIWGTSKVLRVLSNDMYWKVVGYVCGNLLKHKELGTFYELQSCLFSSYGYFVEKYGSDFIDEVVRKVIHVEEGAEGAIDMKEMRKVNLREIPVI